jgi:hypothetical protein
MQSLTFRQPPRTGEIPRHRATHQLRIPSAPAYRGNTVLTAEFFYTGLRQPPRTGEIPELESWPARRRPSAPVHRGNTTPTQVTNARSAVSPRTQGKHRSSRTISSAPARQPRTQGKHENHMDAQPVFTRQPLCAGETRELRNDHIAVAPSAPASRGNTQRRMKKISPETRQPLHRTQGKHFSAMRM